MVAVPTLVGFRSRAISAPPIPLPRQATDLAVVGAGAAADAAADRLAQGGGAGGKAVAAVMKNDKVKSGAFGMAKGLF